MKGPRARLIRRLSVVFTGIDLEDAAVDERLKKIGVASVRVPGKLIASNLKAAADLVSNALAS